MWGEWGDLERIPRFPHKISLTQLSFTIPCKIRTQQRYVFNYLFSDCPHSTQKDPESKENRVFWGCNIRRISVEYEHSFQSDEHQLPIILWVRIDGLNELDDCFTHQVGLIDLIIVTNGGHLVFENDG